MTDNINSLAHSKWNCKYHIVLAPKYRRQIIYVYCKGLIEYQIKLYYALPQYTNTLVCK